MNCTVKHVEKMSGNLYKFLYFFEKYRVRKNPANAMKQKEDGIT